MWTINLYQKISKGNFEKEFKAKFPSIKIISIEDRRIILDVTGQIPEQLNSDVYGLVDKHKIIEFTDKEKLNKVIEKMGGID